MELFSEVYGCYYTVLEKILVQATNGMSRKELEKFTHENAFYESAFHLLPKLFSKEWDLLKENNEQYYSKLSSPIAMRPLTNLEKSWLQALLHDKRIQLFLDKSELTALEHLLKDVSPLYLDDQICYVDVASDGDDFADPTYISHFQAIIQACVQQEVLIVEYQGAKGSLISNEFIPWKISYSEKDNKFRLLAGLIHNNGCRKMTLNLSRIQSVSPKVKTDEYNVKALFEQSKSQNPILLEISQERNALERCMLQFASWEKITEYDEVNDRYLCQIFYDKEEETELLIRILGFGPVVKVLGPESFLNQIRTRVSNQVSLLQ